MPKLPSFWRLRTVIAFVFAACLLGGAAGGTAQAGGLGRPNNISARAFGYGGAFTAIADDPSALHFNPAGLALQADDKFMIGAELIIAPRRYTPIDAAGNRGPDQSPHNKLNALPALGYLTRLSSKGVPSRLALGIGVWNTFGGSLVYDKKCSVDVDPCPPGSGVPALDATETAIIEVVPGVAYEVNEFLAVGFAFRLGIGIFSADATGKPADGSFSSAGLGAGASVGVMLRPSKKWNIGVTYRSALTTNTTGSGELVLNAATPDVKSAVDVAHRQEWPQQASIGLAWKATSKLRLATSADWTDWSKVDKIIIEFPGMDSLTSLTTFHVDFHDSFALHFGGEYTLNPRLALRAGYTFDSNAIPDRTIERQYLDADKNAVGVGAGYALTDHWRVDTAFEYIFGPVRTVPDNETEFTAAGWRERANVSPGEHEGVVYTLELAAQYQY